MLESRAAFGYFGEGHGASGETFRGVERYTMGKFYFLVDWHIAGVSNEVCVTAKNFENAQRAVKAWAKRDGGTFLGENPKFATINRRKEGSI